MIEIRNDEIRDERGQREWADLLAGVLMKMKPNDGASLLAGSGRGAAQETGYRE
jgi:predicted N-formylglutamate amidohydrolase